MGSFGERIRDARLLRGLSLREAARRLAVSPSFLSQIENGKSLPSVSTLYQLSQLYDVSMDRLFSDSAPSQSGALDQARGAIRRTDFASPGDMWDDSDGISSLKAFTPSSRAILHMDSGVSWQQLATNTDSHLDFMEIEYPAGSASTVDGTMLRHAGFEYGLVVEGVFEVTVGFDTVRLEEGDSVGFNSSIPHTLRNPGPGPARGIWVVHRSAFTNPE